jgi:hypothetical protein
MREVYEPTDGASCRLRVIENLVAAPKSLCGSNYFEVAGSGRQSFARSMAGFPSGSLVAKCFGGYWPGLSCDGVRPDLFQSQ